MVSEKITVFDTQ